ncbi:MAG: DUF1674 domain-containing protein [Candidatus Paracaedibacteraceae bacterium]|nr:DUF1674 domain-containing protein [Candidatus Paracaedibacteraceae bacterium]
MPPVKVNEAEEKVPELSQQQSEEPLPDQPSSPTRFGDWEKNGRCIDF